MRLATSLAWVSVPANSVTLTVPNDRKKSLNAALHHPEL